MTDLLLVAQVGGERIAIDAALVESVVDLWQVVPVPLSPEHVIGLAAVRSRVLTVIDAAAAVGLRAKATGNRAIVVDVQGHRYALRVDAIYEVVAPTAAAVAFDANVGDKWVGVAIATVDTPMGFAILIDPARLIGGQALVEPMQR